MWVFVATALVLVSGCAQQDWIDRTLVTVDVSGVWTGSAATLDGQPSFNLHLRLDLRQKAAKVTGFLLTPIGMEKDTRGDAWPIEGNVTNDVFTFEAARAIVTGELTVDADEMKGVGVIGQGRRVTITLRRVEVTAPAGSPPR